MVSNETASNNVDLGQVESWVRLMHDRSEGYVHVCSTLSWSGQVFDITGDLDAMEELTEYVQRLHLNGAKGIYLRTTTIGRALEQGERGSVADSVTLPGLWADIDIAGPGHKTTKPLPPNEAEAQRIIAEAGLPYPTVWVHSGGGLYPWWLFAEPLHLVGEEIIDVVQDISTRWQNVIVAAAERLGYSYGGVGDLARVMRIPGTLNRKTDEPKRCAIVADSGTYFTDDEIAGYLEAAESRMAELTPKPGKQETISLPLQRTGESTGDRPGDDLANRMSWEEILQPAGYQFDRTQGVETYWVRPGKHRRDGHSCTTNYQGSDLLYVFSTEMDGFESNRTYSKFATWSILNGYGLDLKSASKALRAQGFGAQRPKPAGPPQAFQPGPPPEHRDTGGQEQPAPIVVAPHFRSTDVGNGQYLQQVHGDRFRMVAETGAWSTWGGRVWGVDKSAAIDQAAVDVSEMIIDRAEDLREADPDHVDGDLKCKCKGCALHKWGTQSQSDTRIKAMISRFKGLPGITMSAEDFDTDRTVITVGNGVLNPETRELHPFDSRRLLTRQMPVNFDPQATAPKFEEFLAQVLPDSAMRDYVQRAMGYTLLGENDRRAIFMVHGPSGTGKSQFLNIFEGLFGDFGTTAPAATFRMRKGESTNDLHFLRGKRFVTTSETSETTAMDEELVKRITGRDNITSRELYEKNVTWTPNCAIWFATNFPPKLNSDDSAVWARFKPIHFGQQFTGGAEVPDLGKKILAEEAAGILNWLLEGVRKYREVGLGEPAQVTEAVAQQRLDADNVAQFLNEVLEEERLVEREDLKVRRSLLFELYETWCRQERLLPFGQRRFNNRVRALKGYTEVKDSVMCWSGVGLSVQQGLLGRMG